MATCHRACCGWSWRRAPAPRPPAMVAVAEAARRRHGNAIVAVLLYGSCLSEQDVAGQDRRSLSARRRLCEAAPQSDHAGPQPPAAAQRLLHRRESSRAGGSPPNMRSSRSTNSSGWCRADLASRISGRASPSRRSSCGPRTTRYGERVQQALGRGGHHHALRDPAAHARRLASGSAVAAGVRRDLPHRAASRARGPGRAALPCVRRSATIVRPRPSAGRRHCGARSGQERRRGSRWRQRRMLGKLLSVLRLLKASFTFEDGATTWYGRSAATRASRSNSRPWQRRHPILASSVLAWRLYRAGGFR